MPLPTSAPRSVGRVLVVLALLVALAAGIAPAGAETVEQAPDPASEPEATALRVDRVEPALEPTGDRGPDARLAARAERVEPFSMIGVAATTRGEGQVELRLHTDAGWGPWQAVEFSPDHAPDGVEPADRMNSEPIWVRRADGFEVRVPAGARAAGVEVLLVRDTGRPLARSTERDVPPTDPAVAARMRAADRPSIRSRASWGAQPYDGSPLRADNLRLGIVHHSVSANFYSPAEVPGIIRGIQAFHMEGNGWSDIAYNFVVDRFGVIWEGRAGGIGNAVIGGHSRGFNTGSTGVVALGEFGATGAGGAMVNSISTLLGWKLFIHGVDPATTTVFESYGNETFPEGTRLTLPRIIGHRDTSATACPGINLYVALPTIRSSAAGIYDALRGPGTFRSVPVAFNAGTTPLVGDFDGDGNDDVLLYGPGGASDAVAFGSDSGAFTMQPLDIGGTYVPLVADFDADYRDDIFWYGPGDGYDKLWYGSVSRSFDRVDIDVSGTYTPVVGDWDDDDAFDVLWYGPGAATDRLWLGRDDRGFDFDVSSVNGVYEPVGGDFDGDGYDDVLWYAPGSAVDRLWFGLPGAEFDYRIVNVGGDFEPLVGDFTGDQRDDILWYAPGESADALWAGRIDRTFAGRGPVSIKGHYQPIVGDFNGGGFDDVLLYGPGTAGDRYLFAQRDGTFRVEPLRVDGTYLPATLDLGHDARSDILWYGPGGATDRVWLAVA